jgi:Rha family phage regulatory protein
MNIDKQSLSTNQHAIVHLSQGVPVTDSLVIAREFGRKHGNVLQSLDSLIADGTTGRLEFKPSCYLNEQGKPQRLIELTERGALIAMPFIGGKKSRLGQVRLVDAFLAMRDEIASRPGKWLESRTEVSASFLAMMDALQAVRTDAGKETQAHHFSNEAKLVNRLLFGIAGSIDKSVVSESDLKLLTKVEAKNTYLIARGRTYQERKAELQGFVTALRSQKTRIEK